MNEVKMVNKELNINQSMNSHMEGIVDYYKLINPDEIWNFISKVEGMAELINLLADLIKKYFPNANAYLAFEEDFEEDFDLVGDEEVLVEEEPVKEPVEELYEDVPVEEEEILVEEDMAAEEFEEPVEEAIEEDVNSNLEAEKMDGLEDKYSKYDFGDDSEDLVEESKSSKPEFKKSVDLSKFEEEPLSEDELAEKERKAKELEEKKRRIIEGTNFDNSLRKQ